VATLGRPTAAAALAALALALAAHHLRSSEMSSTAAMAARNALAPLSPGRTAVVVGGTSGIGRGAALRLARSGYGVVIVGRDATRGGEVVRELDAESQASAKRPRHAFVPCDASLLANANACAPAVLAAAKEAAGSDASPALDVLVLSQGIATLQGFTPTSEGVDQKLALHYFGRVAWVDALLPAMLRSAPVAAAPAAAFPRIISVLSAGVHSPFAGFAADTMLENSYSLKNAADAAGVYNDLAAFELAARFPSCGFVHSAPGFVSTRWGSEMPWLLRSMIRAIQPLGRSLRDSGEFTLAPAIAARVEGDELAGVAGAGRPGAALLGQNANLVTPTKVHDAARPVVWAKTLEVLEKVRPSGAESALR
jgi:hypothetical protein